MGTKILSNSFSGGEVSPTLMGRTDDSGYKTGAEILQNFIVNPTGSIRSRAGFEFVFEVPNNDSHVRLVPFRFSSDQTLVLLFGAGYMSVLSQGKVVMKNGQPYKMSTPLNANAIDSLHYSQNNDVVTITSLHTPPIEIKRYSVNDWKWNYVNTGATLPAPTGLWSNVQLPQVFYPVENWFNMVGGLHNYVVTALDKDGIESPASAVKEASGNYNYDGVRIQLGWARVNGADRYRVYRDVAGVKCYLGETKDTTIFDEGSTPDGSATPPIYKTPFISTETGTTEVVESSVKVDSGGSGYTYGYNAQGLLYTPHSLRFKCIPPLKITTNVQFAQQQTSSTHYTADNYNLIVTATLTLINSSGATVMTQGLGDFFSIKLLSQKSSDYRTEDNGQSGTLYWGQVDATYALISTKDIKIDFSNVSFKDKNFKVKITFDINIIEKMSNGTSTGTNYYAIANKTIHKEINYTDTVDANYTYQQSVYKDNDTLQSITDNGVDLVYMINNTTQTDCETEIPLYVVSDDVPVDVVGIAKNGVVTETKAYVILGLLKDNIYVINANGKGATFSVERKTVLKSGDNPCCCTQYDQRRVFAGSIEHPLKVWFTNAGFQSLMCYHLPSLGDDRIEIEAVTTDADRIKHMIALQSLILMTGSAELRVYTQNSDSLTPSSIAVKVQSYIGSNDVQPLVVNSTIIFAGNRGGHIYGMAYTYSADGYKSSDISIRAPHLFDEKTIVDMALSKAPIQIVWAVSSNGDLLACTFYLDQNLCAWTRIVTDGHFERCVTITEGNEDRLYVVVNRDGKRYVERMSNQIISSNPTKHRYLDCYLNNVFPQLTKNVSGLSHLEGKTVGVFVDGKPQSNKVVRNGAISLDTAGYDITVGLPYLCKLKTLPITAQTTNQLQGTSKNVSEVFLRLMHDGDVYANLSSAKKLYKVKTDDKYYQPYGDKSKLAQLTVDGSWQLDTSLVVEHRDSLPLEIQGVVYNLTIENTRTY